MKAIKEVVDLVTMIAFVVAALWLFFQASYLGSLSALAFVAYLRWTYL